MANDTTKGRLTLTHCAGRKGLAAISGYTIVELLVVAAIVMLSFISVGAGFARLFALENWNLEKARVLESMCVRAAVMQPRVAIGTSIETSVNSDTEVATQAAIRYPKILFGVSFETNQFLQVTNYVMRVKRVGVGNSFLEGQVYSAKVTNQRRDVASYDWQDELFVRQSRQAEMLGNSVQPIEYPCRIDGVDVFKKNALMSFMSDVPRREGVAQITLKIPVRLRNNNRMY